MRVFHNYRSTAVIVIAWHSIKVIVANSAVLCIVRSLCNLICLNERA